MTVTTSFFKTNTFILFTSLETFPTTITWSSRIIVRVLSVVVSPIRNKQLIFKTSGLSLPNVIDKSEIIIYNASNSGLYMNKTSNINVNRSRYTLVISIKAYLPLLGRGYAIEIPISLPHAHAVPRLRNPLWTNVVHQNITMHFLCLSKYLFD